MRIQITLCNNGTKLIGEMCLEIGKLIKGVSIMPAILKGINQITLCSTNKHVRS